MPTLETFKGFWSCFGSDEIGLGVSADRWVGCTSPKSPSISSMKGCVGFLGSSLGETFDWADEILSFERADYGNVYF